MNRRKFVLTAIATFVLASSLEGPIAYRIAVLGASPDFVLTSLLCISIFAGRAWGAGLGFLGGSIYSALSGMTGLAPYVGYTVAGFVAGWFPVFVATGHWAVGPGIVLVGSLIAKGLIFLLSPSEDVGAWVQQAAVRSSYNAALSVPLYYLMDRVGRAGREP